MGRKKSETPVDERDPAVVAAQAAQREDPPMDPPDHAPPNAGDEPYLCGCKPGAKLVRNAGGQLVCEAHGAQVVASDGGVQTQPAAADAGNHVDDRAPDAETVLEGMIDGLAAVAAERFLKELGKTFGKDGDKYDRGESRARVLDKIAGKLKIEAETVRRRIKQQIAQLRLPVRENKTPSAPSGESARDVIQRRRGRPKKAETQPRAEL